MPTFPITGLDRYRAFVTTTASANPAANNEISLTVPAGQLWLVLGASITLVTDANAANRTVTLNVDDGTTIFNRYVSPSTQAASLTYTYTYAAGGVNATTLGTNIGVGVGQNLMLAPGYKLTTTTTNRQVGDDFAAMTVSIVRYTL